MVQTNRHEDPLEVGSTATRLSGSSILVTAALTRDLSDLSGSYVNGNTAPRRVKSFGGVPADIYPSDQSAVSYNGPWRHANILSTSPPIKESCAQQITVTGNNQQPEEETTILMERNGVVEVIQEKKEGVEEICSLDDKKYNSRRNSQRQHHSAAAVSAAIGNNYHQRTPLIILLMDPGKKLYELMQLWVDALTDTVRDVLYALQRKLSEKPSEKWRQDYDGLFQCRGNQFSQLIHILNVSKYDLQRYEVWFAKPWSMSATSTIEHATEVLRHMTILGVLSSTIAEESSRFKFTRSKIDDAPLNLSVEAQKRVYAPGGILDHHHACQFLTFSPPFETSPRITDQIGLSDIDDNFSSAHGSQCSGLKHRGIRTEKHTITRSLDKITKKVTKKTSKPPVTIWGRTTGRTKWGRKKQPKISRQKEQSFGSLQCIVPSPPAQSVQPVQPIQPSEPAHLIQPISTAETGRKRQSAITLPTAGHLFDENGSASIPTSSPRIRSLSPPSQEVVIKTRPSQNQQKQLSPRNILRLIFSTVVGKCFSDQPVSAEDDTLKNNGGSTTSSTKSEHYFDGPTSARSDWERFRGTDERSLASRSIVSDSAPLLAHQHKKQ